MKLICYICGRQYDTNYKSFRCSCGGYLNVDEFEIKNFPTKDHEFSGLWRYRDVIPINNDNNIVSFGEGFTPIVEHTIYEKKVFMKLDYIFPSGSYKDRGSTVLISKAKELGIEHIIEDSSGNAGSSIALYAAKAKIKADIYVPENTSLSKLTQITASGANLKIIKGNREDTAKAVLRDAEKIYYASHVYNPYFYEGTKTFAFETAEQFDFNLPDTIIIPVGNGTLFIGAYKGFKELFNGGYIKKMPRFIGVQAKNCAPLYNKLYSDNFKYNETLAEGIAIKEPVRIKQIMDIVKSTYGEIITVSESDTKEALVTMLRNGFYIEPTSATAVAALKQFETKNQKVLLTLTGNGLKTDEKINRILKE